jgi:hypothetical protein
MAGRAMTLTLRRDMRFGGSLAVTEAVTVTGSPARRKVRLHDQQTGLLTREGWPDPVTGLVSFSYITAGPWVLISIDHTGEFQATAISDRIATIDGERP